MSQLNQLRSLSDIFSVVVSFNSRTIDDMNVFRRPRMILQIHIVTSREAVDFNGCEFSAFNWDKLYSSMAAYTGLHSLLQTMLCPTGAMKARGRYGLRL